MPLTIRTNNVPRNLTYGYELTPKEREEFDYVNEEDFSGHDFLRYRGRLYDIHEFERIEPYMKIDGLSDPLKGWHGIKSDSFFSGVLIKWADEHDYDKVIVGTFFS